mmetsp:Transcript_9487/g.22841  ORF Transcript_9487/g.22841 Transcript_9487/m.22841 type:complete len:212 (+) Transcript_9487:956-1591(+)
MGLAIVKKLQRLLHAVLIQIHLPDCPGRVAYSAPSPLSTLGFVARLHIENVCLRYRILGRLPPRRRILDHVLVLDHENQPLLVGHSGREYPHEAAEASLSNFSRQSDCCVHVDRILQSRGEHRTIARFEQGKQLFPGHVFTEEGSLRKARAFDPQVRLTAEQNNWWLLKAGPLLSHAACAAFAVRITECLAWSGNYRCGPGGEGLRRPEVL